MGRWSYLDTDEERLPEGMERVGYDADTQTYTYRYTDGSTWEGAPGNRFGKLFKTGGGAPKAYTMPFPPKPPFDRRNSKRGDKVKSNDEKRTSFSSRASSRDRKTLAEKAINVKTKVADPHADKPLPPLPNYATSKEDRLDYKYDDDDAYSIPIDASGRPKTPPRGEEHRFKRQQAREQEKHSEKPQRRGTISRISSYLRRTASARDSVSSQNTSVSRSSTRRGSGEKTRPKRATTFDEIFASQRNQKE